MTLPTEIDQPIECPECGKPMTIVEGSRNLFCENKGCDYGDCVHEKHVAALRNQLPPNHTAIPNAELEALREAEAAWSTCKVVDVQDAVVRRNTCVSAILSHLPKKPDYVALIRDVINEKKRSLAAISSESEFTRRLRNEIAALEAAIKEMEKP